MELFKKKNKNQTTTCSEPQTATLNIEAQNVITSGYLKIKEYIENVQVKKLAKDAQLPMRGSDAAAGYDIYAYLNGGKIDIPAHETRLIGTGLSMAIPSGHFLGIYPRSGLATKQGLRPANCVGVVDSDYRGEIKIALHNDTNEIKSVNHGERIAQVILQNYKAMNFIETDNLTETTRGENGFGSTGNK